MQTLQRFRDRFDFAVAALSALEVEDSVTLRDVAAVLQPAEIVMRIAGGIEQELLELGDEGAILHLQLDELTGGVETIRSLVVRDYIKVPAPVSSERGRHGPAAAALSAAEPVHHAQQCLGKLARFSIEELADVAKMGKALGLAMPSGDADTSIEPRGYRALSRLPRFSEDLVARIVEHFETLQRIMRASVGDLEEVEGVGEARARSLKDGLARQAEATILDRYS